jgi:hypothetical protein
VTDEVARGFYIHTLAMADDGELKLLPPDWIEVPGERPDEEISTAPRRSTGHAEVGKR